MTKEDLALIEDMEALHVAVVPGNIKNAFCSCCDQTWPCDTAQLLALVRRAVHANDGWEHFGIAINDAINGESK